MQRLLEAPVFAEKEKGYLRDVDNHIETAMEAMSQAPPLPGRRTGEPSGRRTSVLLRLPNRSTCPAPRKPRSTLPDCRNPITVSIPVQASAPIRLGGSDIVIRRSGEGVERRTPFSKRPTARGAWISLAYVKSSSSSSVLGES